jgi:hypothetical protein
VELRADRRIRLKPEAAELLFEVRLFPVTRQLGEVSLQPEIAALFDPHMRMARPVADCVAAKLDWHLPRIANEFVLLFKERVLSRSAQKNEKTPVAKVLDVCEPKSLSPRPRRLPNAEAVLGNQFFIDGVRVFSLWDLAGDIKPVPAPDIGDGKLLNESGDARRLAAIPHQPSIFRAFRAWM